MTDANKLDRPTSRNLGQLKALLPFASPYRIQILLALLFLVLGTVGVVALAALGAYIVHGLRVHRFVYESLRRNYPCNES